MKVTSFILAIMTLIIMTSCDPSHDLKLENKTYKKIEVICFPTLNIQELGGQKATEIKVGGRKLSLITLDPTSTIRIGHVSARYNPKPSDIHLDYLEIRLEHDTLKLIGRNAIFSTLQRVEELDWRVIIKTD